MKRHAPAAARNRDPILEVLREALPPKGVVLEIASGSGEHALHFAAALPHLSFQPSDPDPYAVASIEAHRIDAGLPNLRPAKTIDVLSPDWDEGLSAEAVLCINMIHIAPWEACEALFQGAARLSKRGHLLYLYGPYRFDGAFTAPSNQAFDESLRARDPRWGVRDLSSLVRLGLDTGFDLARVVDMPANNHSLLFRRNARAITPRAITPDSTP